MTPTTEAAPPGEPRTRARVASWLSWALVAVACWGVWAITAKLIGDGLTAGQSQALSTLGMLPVMAMLGRSARTASRSGIVAAFTAGAVVCLGNVAYYYALKVGGKAETVKAATVVSVTALYPLVTSLLAFVILKERLNSVQVVGLVLSLVSITIFNVYSVDGVLSGWIAYAIGPILLWGIGGLLQKISTTRVSGETSTFWFLLAFVPVAILLLLWEPPTGSVSTRIWILAAALGLFFSVGNLAILFAFARGGNASVIAPLAGLYPAVSIPIAILFLGEKVTGREWLGIALALISVAALAWEGRK